MTGTVFRQSYMTQRPSLFTLLIFNLFVYSRHEVHSMNTHTLYRMQVDKNRQYRT